MRPFRLLALVAFACALLAPVRAGAAQGGVLQRLRRDHAKRLAGLAATAKEARLGAVALRLYREAADLDPESSEARLALGWSRDGAAWRPPDARVLPGEGWADDGEADLPRIAKREAALRAEHLKDLIEAAAAARGRKDAEEEKVLLWAAVGAAPDDPAPRKALGHAKGPSGGWTVPDFAPLLAGGAAAVKRERLLAEVRAEAVEVRPHAPLPVSPAGWGPVPAGVASQPVGDAVHSLADPGLAREVVVLLARARSLADRLLGPVSEDRDAIVFLHVPGRDLANALVDAEPGLDGDARAWAKQLPTYPLGRTGYRLLVAETAEGAADAAVTALAERLATARARGRGPPRWVAQGIAQVLTGLLLGEPRGYAAISRAIAGETGPAIQPGESVRAFVRRMAAAGSDPSLLDIARKDSRRLHPRDVAKVGSVLDFLYLRDPPTAIALTGVLLAGAADEASFDAAAVDAGFVLGLAELETTWRRWAIGTLPVPPPSEPEGPGAWRVTKLDRAKAFPAADSVFLPLDRPVPGALWFGGRPYTCEVVQDGQAVRLWPLEEQLPARVVREPGTYPFKIPREYGGGWTDTRVVLAREGPSWTVRPADAVTGVLDGHLLTLVDLDLDGRYGSFGRDGVVVGKGAHLVPLLRTMVLGGKSYEIRRVGPDGREIAWRPRALAATGADLDGVRRWNAWRVAAGLPALLPDPALAARAVAAADAHAASGGDRPPPGLAALLAAGPLPDAVAGWMARVDLRDRLLTPSATRVGVATGLAWLYAVVDEQGDGPQAPMRGPVLAPPPGAEGVPTMAAWPAGGTPPPAQGVPITLSFGGGRDAATLQVEAALASASGRPVEVVRFDAAALAAAGVVVPASCAVFVPVPPLAPRATYKVTASWGSGLARVTRTWSFTTGD